MTPNDFLKILLDANVKAQDEIPDGWYSRKQLENLWGVEKTVTCLRIEKGIKLGIIDVKTFRISIPNGVIRKIPHYKFHEKKICKNKNQRTNLGDQVWGCRKN